MNELKWNLLRLKFKYHVFVVNSIHRICNRLLKVSDSHICKERLITDRMVELRMKMKGEENE